MCPPAGASVLIVPANARLEGARFTTGQAATAFPLCGGIVYPEQTVDGAVHAAAGAALHDFLQRQPAASTNNDALSGPSPVRCLPGDAVVSPSFGALQGTYTSLVHVVPPQYADTSVSEQGAVPVGGDATSVNSRAVQAWKDTLARAWHTALSKGFRAAGASMHHNMPRALAAPLLGAGTLGAPAQAAARVAAAAVADIAAGDTWREHGQVAVYFAVQDDCVGDVLLEELEVALQQTPEEG